jgi:gamma-glutamyltranspeptidase
MVIGSPGGPRIIQFTLKAILNFLDFNLDIQKSIDFGNEKDVDNTFLTGANIDQKQNV